MENRIKISFQLILRVLAILLLVAFLLSILWAAYYSNFKVGKTPQMIFYKFDHIEDSLNYEVEYQWVPLDSISRNLIIAILAAQDKNFYIHDGFSPIEENDSIVDLIPKKNETLTQKTARTTFLTKGNSWIKNILETYYTILEEYLWGKERILEIYLNTVPINNNGIFGVEAACQIYFNKKAGDVTMDEAAFIAALTETNDDMTAEVTREQLETKKKEILLNMALMIHIKLGKKPIDEKENLPARPVYRRQWRG